MTSPLRPTSRRSVALLFLLIATTLAALGTLRVHRQHQVVKLGYELSEATAELRQEREDNRRLRLEMSVLTAPERIERLAEGMGLAPPAPGQLRMAVRDDDGRSDDAADADPAAPESGGVREPATRGPSR